MPSAPVREQILIPRTDHRGPTRDKNAVLVLIENYLLQAKPVGQGNVACILTSNIFPSGRLAARDQGAGKALVLLMEAKALLDALSS